MAQNYDVVVVGAGAAGVFMAYEFVKLDKNIKVCIIDQGGPVSKRKCPIDGKKVKSCIHCKGMFYHARFRRCRRNVGRQI